MDAMSLATLGFSAMQTFIVVEKRVNVGNFGVSLINSHLPNFNNLCTLNAWKKK
jgi:hypothetical protein